MVGCSLLTDLRFAYVNQEHGLSGEPQQGQGLFYLRDAQLRTDLGVGAASYQVLPGELSLCIIWKTAGLWCLH